MVDIKIYIHIVNRVDDVSTSIQALDECADNLLDELIPRSEKNYKYYLKIEDKLTGVKIEKRP